MLSYHSICGGSQDATYPPTAGPSSQPSYLPSPQPTQCVDEKDWKVGEDGGIYSSMTCLHINDASEPHKYCNAIDKISDAKFEGKTVREACWYVMFYHYLHLYSMIYYFIKLCPHERRNVFYFISKVNATEVFTSLVFLPCLLLLWCSLHRFQVLRHAWMKKIGTLTILMNLGALTWALIDCVSNLVAFIKAGKMHSQHVGKKEETISYWLTIINYYSLYRLTSTTYFFRLFIKAIAVVETILEKNIQMLLLVHRRLLLLNA